MLLSIDKLKWGFLIGENVSDRKEYLKNYRLTHSKEIKAYNKKYNLLHLEETKEQHRNYYLANKEKTKASSNKWHLANPTYFKKWCLAHPEKLKGYYRTYYSKNIEKIKEKTKKWYLENYKKVKEASKRCNARRKRDFGFIPLNEYFLGAEGHHINYNYIVYIPAKMHHSVWHSLTSGKGMGKINKKAFKFLKDYKKGKKTI